MRFSSVAGLWRELVDRAVVRASSVCRRAVERSADAADHSVVSEARFRRAGKAVRNAFGPSAVRIVPHLENDSASA